MIVIDGDLTPVPANPHHNQPWTGEDHRILTWRWFNMFTRPSWCIMFRCLVINPLLLSVPIVIITLLWCNFWCAEQWFYFGVFFFTFLFRFVSKYRFCWIRIYYLFQFFFIPLFPANHPITIFLFQIHHIIIIFIFSIILFTIPVNETLGVATFLLVWNMRLFVHKSITNLH